MKSETRALQVFSEQGGMLTTQQALDLGIAPRVLYALRDQGRLEQLSRGLYRLADLPPLEHPDLTIVARSIPRGVLCAISALAFHELTTQIPRQVHLALPNHAERPRLAYPPLRLYWLSEAPYQAGVENHQFDGVPMRIYDIEKTIADCFRFRRKLGIDVAVEALKQARQEGRCNLARLAAYARVNRVASIMAPYLEMAQ